MIAVVHETATRIDAPTVFLVALDERLGGLCFSFFEHIDIRIVAVRTVAGACERIAKLLPSIVVVSAHLSADDEQQLEDHASAAGSEVASLAANVTEADARTTLANAFERAEKRRAARSG